MARVNDQILDRLERVIETLQDNSVKMGQMLAVHDEKLDKQDRIDAVLFEKIDSLHKDMNRETESIKKGCERDIRKVRGFANRSETCWVYVDTSIRNKYNKFTVVYCEWISLIQNL